MALKSLCMQNIFTFLCQALVLETLETEFWLIGPGLGLE